MANKRFDHAPKFIVNDDSVVIQQTSGSTAPFIEMKDSAGSVLFSIDPAGVMTATSTGNFDDIFVTTSASLPSDTTIGTVTSTEIGYLDGVTSAIQTQLDSKLSTAVTSLAGTSNQISVSASTGSVTLSIPSSPTFSGTVNAEGFYALGLAQLNRASATAYTNGGCLRLQIDGVTYATLGVNATHGALQASGSFSTPTTTSYGFGDHGFSNFWRPVDAYNNSYFRIGVGSWYSDAANYYLRNASSVNNLTIDASGNTGVRGALNAYSISGNSNVAGTGNASYHPSGIYSTGTNWLYGTIYTNNNSVQAGGGAIVGGNFSASGYIAAGSYVSIGGAYNGPHSNGGAIVRLRSGNEGSFIWDGNFGFIVDATRVKNFTIQHPTKPDNYLVHACSEGPTSDVFYRGTGQLEKGIAVIQLPDYFEDLTEVEGRTVMITPIADETGVVANLAAYEIHNGSFVVEQIGGYVVPNQRFWWRVDAVRKNTSFPVEPLKSSVNVGGFGPYTFIDEV